MSVAQKRSADDREIIKLVNEQLEKLKQARMTLEVKIGELAAEEAKVAIRDSFEYQHLVRVRSKLKLCLKLTRQRISKKTLSIQCLEQKLEAARRARQAYIEEESIRAHEFEVVRSQLENLERGAVQDIALTN